jgi:hypothetical protein
MAWSQQIQVGAAQRSETKLLEGSLCAVPKRPVLLFLLVLLAERQLALAKSGVLAKEILRLPGLLSGPHDQGRHQMRMHLAKQQHVVWSPA